MSLTRAQISANTAISLANVSPFGGAATADADIDESWSSGAGARQFDRMAIFAFVIPALGTQLLDLQADLMQDLTALGLVEVRLLQIVSFETNVGNVTVEPDATDGWTALLQTGSKMNIAPGMNMPLVSPLDGGYAVGASDKELLFTNTDATNTNTIAVIVAGTST